MRISSPDSREYPPRPVLSVGAILVRDGEVLIVKRGAEPGLGRWSVPGGAVELGESIEDAIKRETVEETGLTVSPSKLVGYHEYVGRDADRSIRFHYVIVYWQCEYVEGEAEPSSDVDETEWVDFEELKGYDITDGTLKMLHRVMDWREEG